MAFNLSLIKEHPYTTGAIVIVGGLLANLVIGIFLLPTLYVMFAGDNDKLPKVEGDEEF